MVERVDSARVTRLYDIDHMLIMEGDVIRTIGEHSAAIAATSPGEETWRKRGVLSGRYAYTDEDAAEWDAQDAYALGVAVMLGNL